MGGVYLYVRYEEDPPLARGALLVIGRDPQLPLGALFSLSLRHFVTQSLLSTSHLNNHRHGVAAAEAEGDDTPLSACAMKLME